MFFFVANFPLPRNGTILILSVAKHSSANDVYLIAKIILKGNERPRGKHSSPSPTFYVRITTEPAHKKLICIRKQN